MTQHIGSLPIPDDEVANYSEAGASFSDRVGDVDAMNIPVAFAEFFCNCLSSIAATIENYDYFGVLEYARI